MPLRPGSRAAPAVTSAVTLLANRDPSSAIPVAMPTCRNVELIPDAIPARCGATTPTAVEASGGFTMPMARPLTIMPGIRCVQLDVASRPRISSSPTPIRTRPGPISSRTGTREEIRPAIVAVIRMPPEITVSRTPVARAEYPRMSCRYRTRYSRIEKIEALIPTAAIRPPLKVGSRNRLRSNIGCAMRPSSSTKAISSTPAAAKQPSTTLSVKDFWLDSISA